jgi:amino acid transporter
MSLHRKRGRSLGLPELVAIAIGGMVGGGIFTVLGISVSMIGSLTPAAILLGGLTALLAAYSYVKLGKYYRDEGASFSFFKRTYSDSHFAASVIGWLVVFGYISTLALYAYTFSSYAISMFSFAGSIWIRRAIAIAIIAIFAGINVWSVKGMGKVEDIIVYTKLVILLAISVVLITFGAPNLSGFAAGFSADAAHASVLSVLIVSSITFVAYEGFQLVDNAVGEMRRPEKNIARAIYLSVIFVTLIYVVISFGAVLAIPAADIIRNKEYALAAGAGNVLGSWGSGLVILGAVLATSSAISGTLFGASRQTAAVAEDGYMPSSLSKRRGGIPALAVIVMGGVSSLLILVGGLDLILEFGSITFLLVSLLMAVANFKIRKKTGSSPVITLLAVAALALSGTLILYYEFTHALSQMLFIVAIYIILAAGSYAYSRKRMKELAKGNDTGISL